MKIRQLELLLEGTIEVDNCEKVFTVTKGRVMNEEQTYVSVTFLENKKIKTILKTFFTNEDISNLDKLEYVSTVDDAHFFQVRNTIVKDFLLFK